jgi:xylulokinase
MHIGLDLGTSGVKALLIDDDQAILGEATAVPDRLAPP